MKEMILYLLLVVPLAPPDSLDYTASRLKGDTVNETISNVWDYIYTDYGYEFGWLPKGVKATYEEKIGDCTDYAMLSQYIFKKNNIPSKLEHGYATCNGKRVLHDWLIVNDNIFDVIDCKKYRKTGNGVW